ncbi:MAG: hypothetical protein Kow0042_19710 [Calditrichia bacterium]
MSKDGKAYNQLKERLAKAEEALEALRQGEVDLVVGPDAVRVVRLKSLVEETEHLVKEWQTTFDAIEDAIWIMDAENRIRRCNRAAERLFNLDAESMLGKCCFEMVHGTSAPIPECPFLRLQPSLKRESAEMQMGERWVEVTVDPILDEENNLISVVYIISDITERKQVEVALRESEEKYRRINERITDVVWTTDLNFNTTYVSPSIENLVGIPADEYLHLPIEQKHPPEVIQKFQSKLQEELAKEAAPSVKKDRTLIIEGEHYKPDGSSIFISMHVSFLRDDDGKPIGILGVTRDISEIKRAEEQLRSKSEKLATLLEIHTWLAGSYESRDLFQAITDGAARLFPRPGSATLYLLQDENLFLAATTPALPADFPEKFWFMPLSDHPHIRQAIESVSPVILSDTHTANLTEAEKQVSDLRRLRSLLFLPLLHQTRPLGVLIVSSVENSYDFSDEDIDIFRTLANHAALEIEKSRLVEENQRQIAELKHLMEKQQQTQEALQKSELLFRNMFQKHAAVKLLIDPHDGRIVDANEAAAKFYGWSQEQLCRMKISDIITLPAEQIKAEMEKVRAQERVYFEFKQRRSDGSIRDVAVYSSKIEYAGKDLLHSIVHDITDRKRAEEALANEVTRRRILMEQSRDGIVILDQDGKVYESNRKFAEMLGYSPEEMRQLSVFDWEFLFPPERLIEMIRNVDEKGDHFETKHRRRDGSIYDVEISTNAAWFDGQKLISCICRDITERKQAAQALRES